MAKHWAMLAAWPVRRIKDWVQVARGAAKVNYVTISVCVPAPQYPDDAPTLLVTFSLGPRTRLTFRVRDLEAWDEIFTVPVEVRERLTRGLQEAHNQVAELIEENRLLEMHRATTMVARRARTEVVSEAERIING